MPYVLPDPRDDQQQQAPTVGGAQGGFDAGAGQAPPGGAAAQRPAQSPMMQPQTQGQYAGRSGRFTNLQDMIAQNHGVAGQVKAAGQGALGNAQKTYNTQADPLRKATFQANTNWQPLMQGISAAPAPPMVAPGFAARRDAGPALGQTMPGSQNASNFAGLKSMLDQKYEGPRDLNFDAARDKDVQKADALSNWRTAGQELAVGPYSQGASRFDAGLMGGSGDVRAVQNQAGKDIGAFKESSAKETKDLLDKIAGFDRSAAEARGQVAEGLRGYGNTMLGELGTQSQAQNALELARYGSGVTVDRRNRPAGTGEGMMRGDWTGAAPGSATAANFVDPASAAKFGALKQLLGDEQFGIQGAGQYKPGSFSTVADPNYVPPTNPYRAPTSIAKKEIDPATGKAIYSDPEFRKWEEWQQSDSGQKRMAWESEHPNG